MPQQTRLISFTIRNLAIIENITWELVPGFNILTGETGAGKSILIDGLGLILGEKADRTIIRQGAEGSLVEATFQMSEDLRRWVMEQGFLAEKGEPLIIRRVLSADGQNRQFINGSQTTLQVLKDLGSLLVDIHGPYDHQALLALDAQRSALDRYAECSQLADEHTLLFFQKKKLEEDLQKLREGDEAEWRRRIDYLNFQVTEIERAELKPDEDESLEQEYRTASSSRRILELSEAVQAAISGDGQDMYAALAQIEKTIREWERLDPRAASLLESHRTVWANLRELEGSATKLAQETQVDPERLAEIEARLSLIQSLKKKHGGTIASILEQSEKFRHELDELQSREERADLLEQEISEMEKAMVKIRKKLSETRGKAAPALAKKITTELHELGFAKAEFSVKIDSLPVPNARGGDAVEMMFSANTGESARPLKAVASSGEIARVMLAVKTVLAQSEDVPVLVFDEIDANVGGLTAVTVGKKLRSLAANRQVICITHLPQVAAAGEAHFTAQKQEKGGRTVAEVVRLKEENLVSELGRMLGGEGDAARRMALDLLSQQNGKTPAKTKKKA